MFGFLKYSNFYIVRRHLNEGTFSKMGKLLVLIKWVVGGRGLKISGMKFLYGDYLHAKFQENQRTLAKGGYHLI
jgi:hypothetical protein